MNRQIKFRVWDDRKKEWLCGYEMPNLGGFSLFGETVMLGEWSSILDQYIFERNGHRQDDLKVMQFTGLTDKNGKEIYEGDIFPCLYAFDGCTEHVMVVEYNEPRAGFFPRWDYAKCQQKGVEKTMHDLTSLEVIGNIYENPELLK